MNISLQNISGNKNTGDRAFGEVDEEECVGDYKNVAENQLTPLVLSLMEFIIRPYKSSHKAYERLAKGRLWQRNSTAEFTSSSLSLQFMMTW